MCVCLVSMNTCLCLYSLIMEVRKFGKERRICMDRAIYSQHGLIQVTTNWSIDESIKVEVGRFLP